MTHRRRGDAAASRAGRRRGEGVFKRRDARGEQPAGRVSRKRRRRGVAQRSLQLLHLRVHFLAYVFLSLQTFPRALRFLQRVARALVCRLQLLPFLLLHTGVLVSLLHLRQKLPLALRARGELGLFARVERAGRRARDGLQAVADRAEETRGLELLGFALAARGRRLGLGDGRGPRGLCRHRPGEPPATAGEVGHPRGGAQTSD
mmetsp:Transcript_14674/g.48576  ORF Transcript_14674/g.48576 Transcript_14674/m.48576 type:complete len:204 (+) Transcript_14674:2194-2805(+)